MLVMLALIKFLTPLSHSISSGGGGEPHPGNGQSGSGAHRPGPQAIPARCHLRQPGDRAWPDRPARPPATRRADDDQRDHRHRELGAAAGNSAGRPQPEPVYAAPQGGERAAKGSAWPAAYLGLSPEFPRTVAQGRPRR